jgi:hypothetical protein
MRFRKLRIAWSVLWGVAAVLFIALWVRSYRWVEHVYYETPNAIFGVDSTRGTTWIFRNSRPDRITGIGWDIRQGDQDPLQKREPKRDPTLLGFGWHRKANLISIGLPYWSFVILTIALGGLPWLPRRFSLRTLLIATTLVAVGLGLIVWLR